MTIRIHPENNKLFEFRGKPLVFITPTEHYGAVMNRPFDGDRYLADVAEKHITLTRLFVLFREQQTAINPYSTCKPETPDYISPYKRTGPGRARDEELKYDLDTSNPEYWNRLHHYLARASEYGIIVEVVLLSNTYAPHIWDLNPLNAANNINDVETIEWFDYVTLRNPKLFARQAAHIKKIVTELNGYDNIIYEVCNEPGAHPPGTNTPALAEVNEWLAALIRTVRETEANLPNKHLIVGQQSFRYEPWEQNADLSFSQLDYDVVNMHPLPNTSYGGRGYNLGIFMSKQLNLREMRDFARATYAEKKPLNQDEDNVASQYKDVDGWTIHRKRAWTTLLSGAHYDTIDFSILPTREIGTPESQKAIRTWFGYLSDYMHALDLVHMRPLDNVLKAQPANALEVVYGIPNQDYVIYLGDERELQAARGLEDGDNIDRGAGQPISGEIALDLPAGDWQVSCYDPKTNVTSPAVHASGGPNTRLKVPTFVHDMVVRIQKA